MSEIAMTAAREDIKLRKHIRKEVERPGEHCVKAEGSARPNATRAASSMSAERFKNRKSHCRTAEGRPRATATRNAKSVTAERLKNHEICCGKAKELRRATATLAARSENTKKLRSHQEQPQRKLRKVCLRRGRRAPRLRGRQEPQAERTTTRNKHSAKWTSATEADVFETISGATQEEF